MNLTQAMITALRQRRGIDENDSSQDVDIMIMPPEEIVREMCGWVLGDPEWAGQIAYWMVKSGAKPEDF